MEIVSITTDAIVAAEWNPNEMDGAMLGRLRRSIERFGLVVPLVVRQMASGTFETVGGCQRLGVLKEMKAASVPCVVVEADDTEARLLSQALNRIAGEDDLGLRAELVRSMLEHLPEAEVLSILPETTESLKSLASLGQEDLAAHLAAWQQAQAARLRHLQFQLTDAQLEMVEEALARVLPRARDAQGTSPNVRGTALYLLCRDYLITAGGTS